jgi:hypothetical protein
MCTLTNPYSLEVTLEKLRFYFTEINRPEPLALLEKAVSKAEMDVEYASQMESALTQGSTQEYRKLFSAFGDYWVDSKPAHRNLVNPIDSAMHHIKFGDYDDIIEGYKTLHDTSEDSLCRT